MEVIRARYLHRESTVMGASYLSDTPQNFAFRHPM